jgi:hypothetical protein
VLLMWLRQPRCCYQSLHGRAVAQVLTSGLGLSPVPDLLVLPKDTAHIFLIARADRTGRLCELRELENPWY